MISYAPASAMKSITVLLHDLRGGGAERVMLNLAKGMAAAGRDVTLLLVDAQGDYMEQISKDLNVVNLAHANVFRAVPAIARHLREQKPDAVLSALPHINVALLLAKMLAFSSARIVLSEHNQISLKASGAKGIRRRLTYFLVRRLYRIADAIVAVSNGVARDIERFANLPKNAVQCIYNPSYSPDIIEKSKEQPAHPWFHDGGPDVLLAAGRLHKQKAYDVLLHAMAILNRQRNLRLVVIGEGEERAKLEALRDQLGLKHCVDFAGFCSNPFSAMAKSRLLVMSSAWEGLPTVIIEAMACNLPVVSTDCPSGPNEILEGGRYGHLVPTADPSALSDAIIDALDNPRKGGPERATLFSIENATARYLEVLEA